MIRAASTEDTAALIELFRRSAQPGRSIIAQDRSPDPFARRRGHAVAETFCIGEPGRVDGTAAVAAKTLLVGGGRVVAGYVFDVAVSDAMRGRGLGASLLAHAEQWARGRGARLLYASVMSHNEPSRRLFTRAGYSSFRTMHARVFPVIRAHAAEQEQPEALTDWDHAASLLRRESDAYDFAPDLRDAASLAPAWRSLPGWRDDLAWSCPQAALALWDHTAVARLVPEKLAPEVRALSVIGRAASALRLPFPSVPALGVPLRVGYVLAASTSSAAQARLFRHALAHAGALGLDNVVVAHEAARRPPWTDGTFSITESFDLMVKTLDADAAALLRPGRPLWIDPRDM